MWHYPDLCRKAVERVAIRADTFKAMQEVRARLHDPALSDKQREELEREQAFNRTMEAQEDRNLRDIGRQTGKLFDPMREAALRWGIDRAASGWTFNDLAADPSRMKAVEDFCRILKAKAEDVLSIAGFDRVNDLRRLHHVTGNAADLPEVPEPANAIDALQKLSIALPAAAEALKVRNAARDHLGSIRGLLRTMEADHPSREWMPKAEQEALDELYIREGVVKQYRAEVRAARPMAMQAACGLGLSLKAYGPVANREVLVDPAEVAEVVAACEEAIAHLLPKSGKTTSTGEAPATEAAEAEAASNDEAAESERRHAEGWMPLGWFPQHGIPSERLKKAWKPERRTKRVERRDEAGTFLYSVSDVRRAWPDLFTYPKPKGK